jgi:hypothetical protein
LAICAICSTAAVAAAPSRNSVRANLSYPDLCSCTGRISLNAPSNEVS